VRDRDDVIIFIDEIHNIINVGNGDSNLDVANILKPALARGEINCIGATTIDEYYKHIANDGALSRRFLPIFVDEPSLEETIVILTNIKSYYETFHEVTIANPIVSYLCERVEKTIVNRYFPDKAIDVLDEACAFAKMNQTKEITYRIIDDIIQSINNQHFNNQSIQKLEKYSFLKRYYLRFYTNIKTNYQPAVSLLCYYQDESQLTTFIDDLAVIFNIRDEAIKKLNLSNFQEEHSISNLIGAPPGYVGFNNPNTLTKFVQKYPRAIIVLKNIEQCANNITQLIKDIINSGYIEDLGNNKVFFTNTIIVGTKNQQFHTLGFLNDPTITKPKTLLKFDESLDLNQFINPLSNDSSIDLLFKKYMQFFKTHNINVNFTCFDNIISKVTDKNYPEIEKILYDSLFNYDPKTEIIIDYDEEQQCFVIKK